MQPCNFAMTTSSSLLAIVPIHNPGTNRQQQVRSGLLVTLHNAFGTRLPEKHHSGDGRLLLAGADHYALHGCSTGAIYAALEPRLREHAKGVWTRVEPQL
ncbi:unnamed protein product [Rangifer tarandus platyrhynchus]|uniref:Uncharacterized protein n=1 Tax=Rangifer tarandus platyrhynchus TaxID=3082113 RepID=A0ABN8XLU3_RANTA|nr:unnamed protein product [Rangifer tarandus platyrhynchus]